MICQSKGVSGFWWRLKPIGKCRSSVGLPRQLEGPFRDRWAMGLSIEPLSTLKIANMLTPGDILTVNE